MLFPSPPWFQPSTPNHFEDDRRFWPVLFIFFYLRAAGKIQSNRSKGPGKDENMKTVKTRPNPKPKFAEIRRLWLEGRIG